ncbi:hypothetical protein V6N13_111561 [Hibiscus sabdariffa]
MEKHKCADSRSVVQDRESETVSRNPTRRRSKRKPKGSTANNATTHVIEKLKMSRSPSLIDPPPTEPKSVSSVSDTSPDEDVEGEEMFWRRTDIYFLFY